MKYLKTNLLHNTTYQNLKTFYTQNWLHSMFAAAHDFVKRRREVEDHASIFTLINFDTMSKCLQNIVALKKTSARSLRPFCR